MSFVDLDHGSLTPGHRTNRLADNRRETFASNFAIEGFSGSNSITGARIFGFERKHDVVVIVEPDFVALVGTLCDDGACSESERGGESERQTEQTTFVREKVVRAKAPRDQLNLELKGGVRGDFGRRASLPVRELRSAGEHAELALAHARNALIPS